MFGLQLRKIHLCVFGAISLVSVLVATWLVVAPRSADAGAVPPPDPPPWCSIRFISQNGNMATFKIDLGPVIDSYSAGVFRHPYGATGPNNWVAANPVPEGYHTYYLQYGTAYTIRGAFASIGYEGGFGSIVAECSLRYTSITAPDNATCISYTVNTAPITPGSNFQVTIQVQNTGTNTWTHPTWTIGADPLQGTSNYLGSDRANVSPGNIPPGGNATYVINRTAPAAAGTYSYQWRMVHELVRWFGGTCGGTITVVSPSDTAPTGTFDVASCTLWQGWARDPDWPNGSIRVAVYVDGTAPGNLIGSYPTDGLRSDVNTAFGITGNHGFSIPVPDAYKYGPHTIYIFALGTNASGTANGVNPQINLSPKAYVACPPLASPTCALNAVFGVEPNEPYTPQVTLTYAGGAATVAATTTVTANSTTSTHTMPATAFAGATSLVVSTAPAIPFPVAGSYPVTGSVSGTVNGTAYGPVACSGAVNVPVASKPYFKVLGGDIWSTGGAPIGGFNKWDQTYTGAGAVNDTLKDGKSGAGAQGLIIGSGSITGTASGVYLSLAQLVKPLTFANTSTFAGSQPQSTYGGGFGSVPSAPLAVYAPDGTWLNGSTTSGSYSYTGIDAVYANASVPAGTHMTVYITGTLTITGDIMYAGSDTGYATVASIPHLRFVALGAGAEVRILPNVHRVDAEIISENTIDTCYTTSANKYTDCNSGTLLVNGSLVAKTLHMTRLNGTLRESRPEDGKRSGCPGGVPVASGYCNFANIGELIQFTPEVYLSTPSTARGATNGNSFDSITALPPLF